MTDIAKCNGKDCSLKQMCYRFTSKANKYRQSYIDVKERGKDCTIFLNRHNYEAL